MSYLRRIPQVLGVVLHNRELRAVELAFAGFNAAEWGTWLATIIYAYDRGGATTAGLVGFALLAPGVLVAPIGAVFGDRHRPGRVLACGYAVQTVALLATSAALFLDAAPMLVYVLAGVSTVSMTLARPAQSALLPTLARTQAELTATNAVSGWVESVSVLAAPALTGLLLAVSGTGAVFGVFGLVTLVAALLVLPIPGPAPSGEREEGHAFVELVEGARVLKRERDPRFLVVLLGAQFIGIGALDVLYVVLAVGVLDVGESWAGYLNAAFGAGGALGIVVTAALVGRPRLLGPLGAGLALWFVALTVLAIDQTLGLAVICLALAGVGRAVVDVAGRTLLQRAAPGNLLASIFGLLEGLSMAGLALGSVLVPVLIALGGPAAALVGVAVILPVAALTAGRRLVSIDRRATVPIVEIGLLRTMPAFAPLAPHMIEQVARGLAPVEAAAGEVVIRQGDDGDRWYAVADGELSVTRSGVELATLRRGDGFGEIALLEDVPRTATVTAVTDSRLFALEKGAFLDAVSGHPRTAESMRANVAKLLAEQRRGEGGPGVGSAGS